MSVKGGWSFPTGALAALVVVIAFAIGGCGTAKLEIDGTGEWEVFRDEQSTTVGSGPTTIDVARQRRITVQMLDDGELRARVRSKWQDTPWRALHEPLDAVEFYVK